MYPPPEPVTLITVAPDAIDPADAFGRGYAKSCYWAGGEWLGVMRLRDCLPGPENPPVQNAGATFGDHIVLNNMALLDASARPDGFVRVALEWQATQPEARSFSVFAHVFAADGSLVAQYDSVPGSGLYPVPSWEVSAPVADRFAIHLPAGTAPGTYSVRVGLYLAPDGPRLPVTTGSAKGETYVTVGTFQIEPDA